MAMLTNLKLELAMYGLELALALAVTMLIFSTLTTMVVEIINKMLRLRRVGLKRMLETFYRTEVKQRMNVLLERNGASVEGMPDFVKKLTSMTGGSHTLSTIDFIRRLAETEVGRTIAQRAEKEVNLLIDDITERYEDYGRRASQMFRTYSQTATVVVSIAVAVCLNVNVVRIFSTLQSNEELTRSIAGQAEQVMASYQVQAALLGTGASEEETGLAGLQDGLVDLQESIRRLKGKVDDTEDLGLPIGWTDGRLFNVKDLALVCHTREQAARSNEHEAASKSNEQETAPVRTWLLWAITTLLTGAMVGLGGPFWFDVIKRLTGVSQLAGALVRHLPAEEESGGVAEPKATRQSVLPEDPKLAFRTALRAKGILEGVDAETARFLAPRGLRL